MRIVSLLPATTEWVCAFGGREDLVGCSHECDYPPGLNDVPVVTRATYESAGDSAAIDNAVQSQLQQGLSLYEVDLERMRALGPDLIFTQAQCAVCAVSRSQLDDALVDWAGTAPEVFSLEPSTFKEALDAALRIGKAIGQIEAAMQYLAAQERRLKGLRDRLKVDRRTDPETLPTVACVEWLEPLMTAGHWTPDLVETAGGTPVGAEAGKASPRVDWDELRAADPDLLAIMPCGFSLEETARDLHYLTERPGWNDLRAVREGRVFCFNGNAYFNRPGPRLYRSVELLGAAIHPGRAEVTVEDWEMQPLDALATPAAKVG